MVTRIRFWGIMLDIIIECLQSMVLWRHFLKKKNQNLLILEEPCSLHSWP